MGDLDDDLEFCPNLLSYDERQSVTSGSDRSSLSSGSPDSSPMQSQIQPQQITPSLSISSAATSAYVSPPTFMSNNNNLKIHQPSALRSRNPAILHLPRHDAASNRRPSVVRDPLVLSPPCWS